MATQKDGYLGRRSLMQQCYAGGKSEKWICSYPSLCPCVIRGKMLVSRGLIAYFRGEEKENVRMILLLCGSQNPSSENIPCATVPGDGVP